MRCDLKGVKLRAAASAITVYTISFVCYVAWKGYNNSLVEHSEVFEDISPLIQNGLLLLLFILQHSLLKHVKYELDLTPVCQRLLYLFTTTLTLHVVYGGWQQCSIVYTLSLTISTVQALHLLSWAWLLSSVLLADFAELFGFKHIEHAERGMEEPLRYKSRGAKRVLDHYRHPVAVGPLVLLFACKVMTSDRLLLVVVFVLYTFSRSCLDYQDYLYLRYVSYPARRYTFQKVEIRSRATVIKETHSSFCFSDEEGDVKQANDDVTRLPNLGSDTDLGYSSSPTYHKPEYYKILAQTKPGSSSPTHHKPEYYKILAQTKPAKNIVVPEVVTTSKTVEKEKKGSTSCTKSTRKKTDCKKEEGFQERRKSARIRKMS